MERLRYLTPEETDSDEWYEELKSLLKKEGVKTGQEGISVIFEDGSRSLADCDIILDNLKEKT